MDPVELLPAMTTPEEAEAGMAEPPTATPTEAEDLPSYGVQIPLLVSLPVIPQVLNTK